MDRDTRVGKDIIIIYLYFLISDNVGALVKGRSQSIIHSEGFAFLIDFFLNGFGLVGLGGLQVVTAQ